jgi:hypothetical protein
MNASSSLLFSLAEIKKDSADECSARVQNRRNENNKKLSAAEKKNFFFLLLLKRRRCGCDNITTLPCGRKKIIGFFFNEIVHTSHFFIFPIFWLHLFFPYFILSAAILALRFCSNSSSIFLFFFQWARE